jgi:asparagine synthetase B (glutamine-hydrolysing)
MCGIVGVYHYANEQPIQEELLTTMRDVMPHRGPDGEGVWISPDQKVGLGHRRLSIIDLSETANQPMSNADGTLKYILKKAIRGVIPDELIDRPKQGFAVPLYDWLYGRLDESVREEVNHFVSQTDYFDPVEVNRLLDQGSNTNTWYLFNLALWWKEYIA